MIIETIKVDINVKNIMFKKVIKLQKYFLFFGLGVFLTNCDTSFNLADLTTIDLSISVEKVLHEHISILASDEYGGRAPATPGEVKTIEYLRDNFIDLGVGPGNGDSYFQSVAVTEIITKSDAVMNIEGEVYEATLAYGRDMMVGTQQQVPELNVSGADLVFVGYGIVAPEYEWNNYAFNNK